MKDDFKGRSFLTEMERTVRALRASAHGFAGIENDLASIEEKMLLDLKRSGAIKHPGDKGGAREGILRDFLVNEHYLPARYRVSESSSHVIATDGSSSAQIDLLLYDALNAPRLMTMANVQYFPIESVYGVIEVKSDLNSTDVVRDGLDKVASFKRLRAEPLPCREGSFEPPSTGFGVLFAYGCSLKWKTMVDAATDWQREHPASTWPNLIVVLDQGMLVQVVNRRICIHTDEIGASTTPELYPRCADATLLQFYLLLMDMLSEMRLGTAPLRRYVRLPARYDGHSVRFTHGAIGEHRRCSKHGPYLRQLRAGAVKQIVNECRGTDLVNASEIMHSYERPHAPPTKPPHPSRVQQVVVYNPEEHGLGEVFYPTWDAPPSRTRWGATFDALTIDEQDYWIPTYYVVKHQLIEGCPKCVVAPAPLEQMTLAVFKQVLQRDDATPDDLDSKAAAAAGGAPVSGGSDGSDGGGPSE